MQQPTGAADELVFLARWATNNDTINASGIAKLEEVLERIESAGGGHISVEETLHLIGRLNRPALDVEKAGQHLRSLLNTMATTERAAGSGSSG